MRAFIAIELPPGIQKYLANLQNSLKKSDTNIKWVKSGNIHLTLKFLGDINEEQIDLIKKIIEKISSTLNVQELELNEIGAFPKKERARIIWVGINDESGILKKIAINLENEISKIDIPKETRPFSAHITLGRIKIPRRDLRLAQLLEEIKISTSPEGGQNLKFTFSKITLFKSTLTARGPIYERLYEGNLKNNPTTKIV